MTATPEQSPPFAAGLRDRDAVRSVAVIGAGNMGAPIARRLICAGFDVIVCDASGGVLETFRSTAQQITGRPSDCAGCDVVLILVNTERQLRDVLVGDDGLWRSASTPSRALVVVMSTVEPVTVQNLARAAPAGASIVDAPVSGGEKRAEDGTLSIMMGGSAEDLARARTVLRHVASHIFACGDVGSGQIAKLLNNVIATFSALAMAEVAGVSLALGMTQMQVGEILEASTGRNFLTEAPAEISGYFARFASSREVHDSVVALFRKDAAAVVSLLGGTSAGFPAITALADLVNGLGEETYGNWAIAGNLTAAGLADDASQRSLPADH